MRVVHGLKGDAGVIAVEVAVLDQVLDGVDDLGDTRQCAGREETCCMERHVPASAEKPAPAVLPTLVSCVKSRSWILHIAACWSSLGLTVDE